MSQRDLKINQIVAMERNFGIGLEALTKGTLPWKLPQEGKMYRDTVQQTSLEKPKFGLVMGRKTFELHMNPKIKSHYQAADKWINFVVTQSWKTIPEKYNADNVFLCHDWEEVLLEVKKHEDVMHGVWNIGGPSIYEMQIQQSPPDILKGSKLYLTQIDADFVCDQFYPKIDISKLRLSSEEAIVEKEENGIKWTRKVYEF